MRDRTDDLSVIRGIVNSGSGATCEIWRTYGVMEVCIVFVWSWSCQGKWGWTTRDSIRIEEVLLLDAGVEIT